MAADTETATFREWKPPSIRTHYGVNDRSHREINVDRDINPGSGCKSPPMTMYDPDCYQDTKKFRGYEYQDMIYDNHLISDVFRCSCINYLHVAIVSVCYLCLEARL